MKIVIVDDSADARLLALRLVSNAGFEDVIAVDSAAALYRLLGLAGTAAAAVEASQIGVLLLDVHMPAEDGISACQRLKADPQLRDIPVLMVTADTSPEVLGKAFAAGAADYITKPYARQELQARVRAAAERRRMEKALREDELKLRQITSALGEGLYVLNPQGELTFMNPEAERLLGWTEDELRGRQVHTIFHKPLRSQAAPPNGQCPVLAVTRRGRRYSDGDDVFIHRDGSLISVAYVATPIIADGEITGVVVAFQDIGARKAMEAELRLAAKLVEFSANAILVTDPRGVIESANPAFTRITGYEPHEVRGQRPTVLASGRHSAAFYKKMWQSLLQRGRWEGEIWNRRKDGTVYPEWLSISAIYDSQGRLERYMAVFLDITQQKEAETKLKFLADNDYLTGLPNRKAFGERLEQALAAADGIERGVALMFLDLDGFKPVNDELGHDAGDLVLKEIACRLQQCVRASDTVARFGGDEFVILLADVPLAVLAQTAEEIALDVLQRVPQPILLEGRPVSVGVSIGIALYPHHGRGADSLLTAADSAMYDAKQAGRMRCCFSQGGVGVA